MPYLFVAERPTLFLFQKNSSVLWTNKILLVRLICSVIENQVTFYKSTLFGLFLLGRHDSPLMHHMFIEQNTLVMFSLKLSLAQYKDNFRKAVPRPLFKSGLQFCFNKKKGVQIQLCVKKESKSSDFGASFLKVRFEPRGG